MSYRDALKDPECKASYKTGGGPVHATRVAPLVDPAEVRAPIRHPLRNILVDPGTGRRLNQIVPVEATNLPVATQVETRGATRVPRNGRGVGPRVLNMTRYGPAGTFTREDARRIDEEYKEMRNKPTVNSVTY